MNQLQAAPQTTHLLSKQEGRDAFTMANLVFNPQAMQSLRDLAEMLANQSGLVPDHFNGKPGDVMAIIMQAGRWDLDPIAVAQSTFVISGKIGYEAKLLQAIATGNGGITFEDEFYGDWTKIVGRTKKAQVTRYKPGGGQYTKTETVPAWTSQDEVGVGLKLTGTFPDGRKITIDIALNSANPRHSTNWTYDPQTQLHYTAVKRWIRRYAPHLAAGIRDYDDIMTQEVQEKEINPTNQNQPVQVSPVQQVKSQPSDINELLQPIQKEPEPVTEVLVDEVVHQPQTFDDLLSNQTNQETTSEKTITQFDDLMNMIREVKLIDDYKIIKQTCIEVVNSGELSGNETKQIRQSLNSKFASLNEQSRE